MQNITLTGLLDRTLNEENVEETWKHQIDILMSEHNFTREAAFRMCAIAEHFEIIRLSEKVEYISEILKMGLPYGLACDIEELLKKYYAY